MHHALLPALHKQFAFTGFWLNNPPGASHNAWAGKRDVLVLEMDKWSVAYLNGRNMISIPLAKTGDSERRQILAEYALVARNEKASGGVFDNTTS